MKSEWTLIALAAEAANKYFGTEAGSVVQSGRSDSQTTFVCVEQLPTKPSSGGGVVSIMMKSDGTEGILYPGNEVSQYFTVSEGKITFKGGKYG